MSGLLSTIEKLSSQAASALKEADYLSDADIRILTRQDLNELLPGPKNLILRKKIFDSIQEHEPINGPSRGGEKVLPEETYETDLKEILSDIRQRVRTDLHNVQSTLAAQILLLDEPNEATHHQESGTSSPAHSGSVQNDYDHPQGAFGGCPNPQGDTNTDDEMETSPSGVMSSNVNDNSQSSGFLSIADVKQYLSRLHEADYFSDADIKILTPQDLNELLPGLENLKLRKKIFDTIQEHFQEPINGPSRGEDKVFPEESSKTDLKEILSDIRQNLKTSFHNVQTSFDDCILLLDQLNEATRHQESGIMNTDDARVVTNPSSDNGKSHGTNITDTDNVMETSTGGDVSSSFIKFLDFSLPKMPQIFSQPDAVKYKMVVSGKTFGADQLFMKKVEEQFRGQAKLTESNDDHQVTILFCPIVSRMVTDIQAAMADVKDDKPIILVMMHHSHEPKVTPSVRKQVNDISTEKIVLDVSVFFHETLNGLVQCQENDTAASVIQKELQKYISKKTDHTSGQSNMEVKNRRTGEEPFTMLHHPDALRYKMVVSGQTFGAHQQFMKKVEDQFRGRAQHIESNDDHQVTILFCPMISHMGSDIQAAMAKMEAEKHILLVSMHHSLGPTVTPSTRTWVDYPNIKLHVNVFFHETQNGLIMCHENDDSVSAISNELQKFCPLRNEDTTEQNNQGTTVAKKAKSDGEGSDKQSFLGFSLSSFSKKKK